MLKRINKQEINYEDNHSYISISDLMTSLLFIFILILSYVMLSFVKKEKQLSDEIKKIEENIQLRSDLLKSIQAELLSKNIHIDLDAKNGNIRLKSDLLFKQGSADISDFGKIQISEIAKLIAFEMLKQKYKKSIDTIFIEGHTDSLPTGKELEKSGIKSNKELSAQRAINTYLQMDSSTANKISKLKNKKGKHLLSYSGYADTRQLCKEAKSAKENLKSCRSKNRRIEFYFTINTPEISEIKEHLND